MLSSRSILSTLPIGLAIAKSTSTTQTLSTNASTTQNISATSYPVVSVFLPIDNISAGISASIVDASRSQTTFAFAYSNTSLTLTEGESTLLFTSPPAAGGTGGLTINCAISGATSSANISATAAVCTGTSPVGGLEIASTSTLPGAQIRYVPVTVTDGEDRLFAVLTQSGLPKETSRTTTSRSGNGVGAAAVPVGTGMPVVVAAAAAAAGMMGVGLL